MSRCLANRPRLALPLHLPNRPPESACGCQFRAQSSQEAPGFQKGCNGSCVSTSHGSPDLGGGVGEELKMRVLTNPKWLSGVGRGTEKARLSLSSTPVDPSPKPQPSPSPSLQDLSQNCLEFFLVTAAITSRSRSSTGADPKAPIPPPPALTTRTVYLQRCVNSEFRPWSH